MTRGNSLAAVFVDGCLAMIACLGMVLMLSHHDTQQKIAVTTDLSQQLQTEVSTLEASRITLETTTLTLEEQLKKARADGKALGKTLAQERARFTTALAEKDKMLADLGAAKAEGEKKMAALQTTLESLTALQEEQQKQLEQKADELLLLQQKNVEQAGAVARLTQDVAAANKAREALAQKPAIVRQINDQFVQLVSGTFANMTGVRAEQGKLVVANTLFDPSVAQNTDGAAVLRDIARAFQTTHKNAGPDVEPVLMVRVHTATPTPDPAALEKTSTPLHETQRLGEQVRAALLKEGLRVFEIVIAPMGNRVPADVSGDEFSRHRNDRTDFSIVELKS